MELKLNRAQLYKQALTKLMTTTNLGKETFIAPLFDDKISEGLMRLDAEIGKSCINLRSIKNNEYIKEVFESYLVDDKKKIEDTILEVQKKLVEQRTALKKEISDLKKSNDLNVYRCNELKKEIEKNINRL